MKAAFDDGTSTIQYYLTFTGEVVYRGQTDREGKMEYAEELEWDKIVAEDNYGHRAEFKKGADEGFNIPRWLGAIIGFTVLLSMAAISHYYSD